MANTIKHKRSATASKVPLTTDLQLGELAINTFDGKLFLKKNDGADSILQIGAPFFANMRAFSAGAQYVPSAGTTSILVILTGAGGAGGAVLTSNVAGMFGAPSGAGGGTIIFSMNANSTQTFQIGIGAATTTTLGSGTANGASGSASTFGIVIGGVLTNIATAPGGAGGVSVATPYTGTNNWTPPVSSGITAPNATYVAVTNALAVRGGDGNSPSGAYAGPTGGYGLVTTAPGGGSFWGVGAGASSSASNTGVMPIVGKSGVVWGTGGAGGAKLAKTTTSSSANGGAGAQGICMILEIKN